MLVETTKKLFTVDEYHRMAETGIIGPKERVELIDGEIIKMSPIGHRHRVSVNLATELFVDTFKGRAIVSIQNGLRLSNNTEPEPDLVLLKYRSDRYRGKKWTAEDALLVIEVADTSLRYDREIKLLRYAAAGIPEVWIENLEANEILVYRDLGGGSYTTFLTVGLGDTISVAAFPDTKFKVEDLLA